MNLRRKYGPWALVTGASAGIGAELAEQLAGQGLHILAVARDPERLDALATRLRTRHGVEVRTVSVDLTLEGGTQAVIDAAEGLEVGVLVPCAAVARQGRFLESSIDEHLAMAHIDMVGPMLLLHHFGREMATRGRGAVLLVGSLAGWYAQPYMAHYAAAKSYVVALGESLHHELADAGIDVTVLSPGPTDTKMAADAGIDFEAWGLTLMDPAAVARDAMKDLLRRRSQSIPGLKNRLLVAAATRLLPRAWVGSAFRAALARALGIGPSSIPPRQHAAAQGPSAKPVHSGPRRLGEADARTGQPDVDPRA